jgi:hypothetical protein
VFYAVIEQLRERGSHGEPIAAPEALDGHAEAAE